MTDNDHETVAALVVDGDASVSEAMIEGLRGRGYRAESAPDGRAALRWLGTHRPVAVLFADRLPDMSGEEFLKRLRKLTGALPFLVATGHRSGGDAAELVRLGARGYLSRNLTFLELVPEVVGQALGVAEQEAHQADAEARLRAAEEELLRARQELESRVEERTAELAAANRELREQIAQSGHAEGEAQQDHMELAHVGRLTTLGEMVAGLAHELKQPLTAIATHAQAWSRLLESDDRPGLEELAAFVKQVNEQAVRASEIINRLRRSVTRTTPAWQPLEVNALVRETSELVGSEARAAGVEILFDLAEPSAKVCGDRIQLEQVLVNLMRNAIEAMVASPGGPRLLGLQSTSGEGGTAQVVVRDTGAGLPPGEPDRVFERFFTTKADGMGMGLSISRSIAESHGGRLTASNDPDRGAVFQLSLPVAREDSAGDR